MMYSVYHWDSHDASPGQIKHIKHQKIANAGQKDPDECALNYRAHKTWNVILLQAIMNQNLTSINSEYDDDFSNHSRGVKLGL